MATTVIITEMDQTTATTEKAAAPNNLEEFMADMESLAEATEQLPPVPVTYSRENIYFDHD